jgi:ATP-dependent exoDNAse (exonuclease V) beta subunit
MACVAQGVAGTAVADCIGRATTLVDRVLADADGQWLLGRFATADVEPEYSVVLDRRLVTVRFDRMFVDAAGVRWIVDYKSGALADGPAGEDALATEVDRYRPQLARYRQVAEALWSEPVRTALYFTSLPRLVVVD